MALISYYKAKVPCQDMAMVSLKRIPHNTMTSHGNGKWFNGK
ncbi:hypothetical protein F383_21054 [Gossypium arboreum]|uniref:Uncharacterized protein n=1 Tax=Gossypium arboreum TaxID=29729 RepID=A0A0B0NYC7_GOSAR|nr:hypothetical protein F383_21054 [Gossypium arboreum]